MLVSALSVSRVLQFSLLVIAAMAASYARSAVGSIQEAVRVALALSDNRMAILQGPALALPMVVAAIPLGLLIDRYARVRLLLVFSTLDALGTLWSALASDFATLLAARSMVGLAVSAISTTAFSLLPDLFAPAQRGRASMILVVSQYAGMSAAFGLGGLLIAAHGAGAAGWSWTMLWLTLPLAVVVLFLLGMREPTRAGFSSPYPSVGAHLADLLRHRAVIGWLMTGMVFAEMTVVAVLSWAAPALSRSTGLPPQRVGAIMAVALLVSGVGGPLAGGFLADFCHRFGGMHRTTRLLSALALLGMPAGCFALVPGVGLASALLVAFMTLTGATLVAGIAVYTIALPSELRGIGMASLGALQVLCGVALAPVLVSLVSGLLGGPAYIGSALSIVVVLTSVFTAVSFVVAGQFLPRTS